MEGVVRVSVRCCEEYSTGESCPFWLALQNKAALEKFETDLLAVIGKHRHLHLRGCVLTCLPLPQ